MRRRRIPRVVPSILPHNLTVRFLFPTPPADASARSSGPSSKLRHERQRDRREAGYLVCNDSFLRPDGFRVDAAAFAAEAISSGNKI